jgi:hypothetical protein
MDDDASRSLAALAVVAALAVLAATATAPAVGAQAETTNETNVLDTWLEDEDETADDNGWLDLEVDTEAWKQRAVALKAALSGQFDRLQASLAGAISEDEHRANAATVERTKTEINTNSDTYVEAINNRTSPSTDADTHRVIVSSDGSPNAALYIVGNVTTTENESTLHSLTALNATEFNASYSNRSVDETWAVDGDAADDLPSLADSLAGRIADNESLGTQYQAQLVGRYCGSTSITDPGECDVRSTLWLSESQLDVDEWQPDDEDDDWVPFASLGLGLGLGLRNEVSRHAA